MNKGEIVGLIGPNGAGKTTLFNVITGIYRPEEGTIRFHGKDLVGLKPHRICRRGIARTFQLVRIFPSMTVLENVAAGGVFGHRRIWGGRLGKYARELLDRVGLEHAEDPPLLLSLISIRSGLSWQGP